MKEKNMERAAAIKAARLKNRLSQDQFAVLVGAAGRRTVINWERDGRVASRFVPAIVEALDLDAALFVDEDEGAASSPLTRDEAHLLTDLFARVVNNSVATQ